MKIQATIEFDIIESDDGNNNFHVIDDGDIAATCASLTEAMEFVSGIVYEAFCKAVRVHVVD